MELVPVVAEVAQMSAYQDAKARVDIPVLEVVIELVVAVLCMNNRYNIL